MVSLFVSLCRDVDVALLIGHTNDNVATYRHCFATRFIRLTRI